MIAFYAIKNYLLHLHTIKGTSTSSSVIPSCTDLWITPFSLYLKYLLEIAIAK